MSDPSALPPARLHFFLAREAPVGVVLRRGPSKWVRVIHWDTSTDTFTPGHWFHGRIYERQCDLSPDGTKLLYFASKQAPKLFGTYIDWRRVDAGLEEAPYLATWTALSKPPWLTALALWPKGETWGGGGLFPTDSLVWLDHLPGQLRAHPNHLPQGVEAARLPDDCIHDGPLWFRRLERDGWKAVRWVHRWYPGREEQKELLPSVHEKPAPDSSSALRLTHEWVRAPYPHDFSLWHLETSVETPLSGVTDADWDHRGRLIVAREGKLWSVEVNRDGTLAEHALADFNDQRPEAIPPPDWARQW